VRAGEECRHEATDVDVEHLVAGVSKGITYIAGQVEYFPSFLN